jgi:hypothetical protein
MKLQLMVRRQWRQHLQHLDLLHFGLVLLLCMLVLLLSACSNPLQSPARSGTPETGGTVDVSTPTPVISPTAKAVLPTITLQVSGCPSTISLNWDKLVGTRANINKVQKVTCGSLEGSGTLQAVVDVRYYSPDAKLDCYVYDNLPGTPSRRFNVSGLLNGDASISSVGTLMTAEVSPGDAIQGVPDIFKEYQWNGSALVQVPFLAIYPDVTRFQAERAQALVFSELAALQPGQSHSAIPDGWRLGAGGVVSHLAQRIFHWQPSQYALTLPAHASQLSVLPLVVTYLGPGGGGFVATVHHLNDVPTNIFEVYAVTSINGNSSLNSPSVYAGLTSPVKVNGASVASGNILGQVVFYDDMYINVGDSGPIRSSASTGYISFANSVNYHLGARGLEEGVVAFYATSQNNADLSNQVVMVKVFLGA